MSRQWVLITGCTGGLGSALAHKFWSAGWNLGLVARNKKSLDLLLGQLGFRDQQSAIPFLCNLQNEDEIEVLCKEVEVALPFLNALINNAAIHGPIGPLEGGNFKLWKEAIQVDLLAPVLICGSLIKMLKKVPSSSIINISGGGATGPRENFSAYATAKAGLVRFSETLAEELKASNVRVNCVAPGVMQTALLNEVVLAGSEKAGLREFQIASGMPVVNPIDLATDLIFFLADQDSKGITGKLISAVWDNWQIWNQDISSIAESDVYTLRRIAGRDRNLNWADK